MLVTGKTDLLKTILYISGQLIGACLGASVIKYFVWSTAEFGVGVHSLAQGVTVADGIAIEFFLTFILVFTFFSLGFYKRNAGAILPFVIGTIYLVDSLVAIPLTGASMNPARSFGPSLIYMEWNYHWLYWLGPILGGIVGSCTYVLLFGTAQEKKTIGVIKINGKS
jgi:glycerol uptake facilitator-like aquaporin